MTVNHLADAGIVLRSDGTNDGVGKVQLILGGNGYGQGTRGGNAGSSLYFCTTAFGCNAGEVNNVFTPGTTYTISVTVNGGTYSVAVDGSTVDTFVDTSDPLHGQVGLYDDQPNTTTGAGFGTPNTFSNLSLVGSDTAPSAVPEPASTALLMIGLAGLGIWSRRRLAWRVSN